MTPDEHTETRAREALHTLLESLGDATGVLLELRTYLEALDAYYSQTTRELLERGRRLLRAAAVIGGGVVLALTISAIQQRKIEHAAMKADVAAAEVSRVATRNTLAIRVSCTLLSNKIIEAGGAGATHATKAGRAQQEINDKLIAAIARELLTSAERAEINRLSKIVVQAGGTISLPDCDEIARHPEGVRAIPLAESPRAPMNGRRP